MCSLETNEVILHIGYHKCASTYLQTYVFPMLPVNFRMKWGKDPRRLYREMLDYVRCKDFDPHIFLKWIKTYWPTRYKVTLISNEELSGHPHGYNTIDWRQIAINLKKTFPNAKILVIIREQLSWLKSLYAFKVVIKGEEIRKFNEFVKEESKIGLTDKLEYDRLIKFYVSLFGVNKVLVLPVELLMYEPDVFHGAILDLMGFQSIKKDIFKSSARLNVSPKKEMSIHTARILNNVFLRIYKVFQPFMYHPWYDYQFRHLYYRMRRNFIMSFTKYFNKGAEITLTPELRELLLVRYAHSNLRLQKFTPFSLEKLGYSIG